MAFIELGPRELKYLGLVIYVGTLAFFTYATVDLWDTPEPIAQVVVGVGAGVTICLWVPALYLINARLGIIALE